MEEGVFAKEHFSKYAAQAPHIERGVVQGVSKQELRALEVEGRHPYRVGSSRNIVLRKAPVHQAQLPSAVVDHYVLGKEGENGRGVRCERPMNSRWA